MTRSSTFHDRKITNKDYLNTPAYQSVAGQRAFLYRAIKLWKSLPRAITAADSLRILSKRNLENFFLSMSMYLKF